MLEQVLFFTIVASFLETTILLPMFIPFLRRLKFGQSIREDGPQAHLKKAGTPTMGGIIIVVSAVIATMVMVNKFTEPGAELLLLLIATLGFGMIGFVDDFIKIVMKRNLGLTSKQKLLMQFLVSLLFYFVLTQSNFSTVVGVEAWGFSLDLRFLYPVFVVLYLSGFSNAVNFTDGLDGLLSGTAAIAFGAFTIIAWSQQQYEIALYCVAMVGALLGFLVFNAYPAKIFMGDMGSLAIGGGIAAVAILLKQELLLVLIGGIFMIEILSVVLQVISFKTTGKRIFKMSPIHHHFELSGWSEWRVVTTFWLVGLAFAITGVYIGVYW